MILYLVTSVLFGFLSVQEPDEALQRGLAVDNPAERRLAAMKLASLGEDAQDWLMKEIRKGDAERRRALLLAAALMGTSESQKLLARSSRKGSRPEADRAWALLLYGAFHPEAAAKPHDAMRRAASDFERCCVLAGLLAQAGRIEGTKLRTYGGSKALPALQALVSIEEALAGRLWLGEPSSDAMVAARLLTSQFPAWVEDKLQHNQRAVSTEWLEAAQGRLPELWIVAARRSIPRKVEDLRSLPPGGAGAGLALVLYELVAKDRQLAFEVLHGRLVEPEARAWLWGAAGDLKLSFEGVADSKLSAAEVAGLAQLALRDFSAARRQARLRGAEARKLFTMDAKVEDAWPAGLILALGAEGQDLGLLRRKYELAEGRDAERLQPIWYLASGKLKDADARNVWLNRWSRELGGGYQGYLDREGKRFTAFLLVQGTQAALERNELSEAFDGLTGPRDHSLDDELYADLAEFLLSPLYRWDLP